MMHRMLISFRVEDLNWIDLVMQEHGLSSKSEAIRFCIAREGRRLLKQRIRAARAGYHHQKSM
jgi:hypothetical protein